LGSLGLVCETQGHYTKALDYYSQSLKIAENIGNQPIIARSLNNIGLIYKEDGDYSKALEYYLKSLELAEQLGNKHAVAGISMNIGVIHNEQGNYPKSLDFYSKSLETARQVGNQQGVASTLVNMGNTYNDQGKSAKSLDYLFQGLAIYKQTGNKKEISNTLYNIGNTFKKQGDYTKALNYCKEGYELALSINALLDQKRACQCLYETYKAVGKGNEALNYMEKAQVINDSLNKKETAKKLQQMEFKKQVYADSIAKVEEARLVQEAHEEEMREEEEFRNIAIGAGIFILVLAGGIYSRLRYVRKAKGIIEKERDRSDNLLLNILPEEIARELKEKGKADARDFDMVSILFTDFKGFTVQSEKLSAADLVNEINECFKAFDAIIEKYAIEKIKTIGDAYMAAGGLPVPSDDSVKNTVLAALEMQKFIKERKREKEEKGEPAFEMRVGIHTGPVVAGIVGVKKFQYDIWGDTVNTASRMESSGLVGEVNISEATYAFLKDDKQLAFKSRGKIHAKGKGEIEMYLVNKGE